MRTNQPQTIYLSDYRVPAYLVDTVDLRFELFEEGARVHSTLSLRRNPAATEPGTSDPLARRDLNPRDRKLLTEIVIAGSWGQAAKLE